MQLGHELGYSKKKYENEFTPPWIKFPLEVFQHEIPLQGGYPTEINQASRLRIRI